MQNSSFWLLIKALASASSGTARGRKNRKGKYSKMANPLYMTTFSGLLMSFALLMSSASTILSGELPALSSSDMILLFRSNTLSDISLIGALCLSFVLASFFSTKSDDYLKPFPIPPFQLFLAKSVLSLLYILPYSLTLILDSFVYLYWLGAPAVCYFSAALVFLLIVPVFLSFFFILWNIIGTIFSFRKRKNIKNVFLIVLIIPLMVLYIMLRIGIGEENFSVFYHNFDFINWLSYVPVNAMLVSYGGDGMCLLYQLLISASFLGLAFFVSKKLYLNNVGEEDNRKKKKLAAPMQEKSLEKSLGKYAGNNYRTYVHKELASIRANMVQFLPTVLMGFCFGAMMIGVILALKSEDDGGMFSSPSMVFLFLALACLMTASAPYSAYLSISMEGKGFYLLKSFPLKLENYLLSKTFLGNAISLVLIVILLPVLVLVCGFDPWMILLVFLFVVPIILISNKIALAVGIRAARFDWNTLQELTQSNLNAFLISLYHFILSGAYIGVGFGLMYLLNMKSYSVAYSLIGVLGMDIVSVFVYMAFSALDEKRFKALLKRDI